MCSEFKRSARSHGPDGFFSECFPEIPQGVFTGTMATMESEPVCHETARAPDSFRQNRFTGVRQVKPANDGKQFFFGKFLVNGAEDVGITGMTASDNDNQSFLYPDDDGGIVDQRNGAGTVLIEKIPGNRGEAARFSGNVRKKSETVAQLGDMIDSMKKRRSFLAGQIGHAGDADRHARSDLVGFVPDVGRTVNGRISLEPGIERQSSGMVVMPVGDGDAGQIVQTDTHSPGVFHEDIGRPCIDQPAVAAGQFDENRDTVFGKQCLGCHCVIGQNGYFHFSCIGGIHDRFSWMMKAACFLVSGNR